MLYFLGKLFGGIAHSLLIRFLRHRVRSLNTMPADSLRLWRNQSREALVLLRKIEKDSDAFVGDKLGTQSIPIEAPPDATFSFRPSIFYRRISPAGIARPKTSTRLGPDITLHHDLENAEMIARQIRHADRQTRYGLSLEAFDLSGSFLSFAIALPPEEAPHTRREDLIRLNYDLALDRRVEVFARLNLRHGPNVEQIVREVDLGSRESYVEFDLFYTKYEPEFGKGIWIDLIFQTPTFNVITLYDLTVIRRPRMSL